MLIKLFKNFVRYHKGIFTIFVVLQLLSVLSVILVLSVFRGNQQQAELYDNSVKQFTVTLPTATFTEEISAAIQHLCKEHKDIFRTATVLSPSGYRTDYVFDENTKMRRGRYFTQEEFFGKTPKILLRGIAAVEKVGDIVTINGVEYEVIGFTDHVYHAIPYQLFPNGAEINRIEFVLKEKPNKATIGMVEQTIKKEFGTSVFIQPPDERDSFTEGNTVLMVAVAIGIVLLSIINIAYLYQYILEQRKPHLRVMQIYGATGWLCTKYLLAEILLITTVIYGVSVGISELVYPLLVQDLFTMAIEFSFGWGNYAVLYIAYIAVVLLVFFKFIRKTIASADPVATQ